MAFEKHCLPGADRRKPLPAKEKLMKRLLTILLTLSLILSLTACGSKADADTPDDPAGQEQEQENTDTQQPDGETEQDEPDGAENEDGKSETEQPTQQPEKTPEQKPDTKTEEKPAQKPAETPEQKPAETPAPEQPKEEPKEEQPAAAGDPLSILSTVWKSYTEDEKFPSTEPISVDVSDTDSLSYQLTFPAEDASLINSAASLMHMMNMNTFTCGAFHAADAKDVSTLASDLRSAIQGKQWMCGFPEKLVIVTMDQYVISMYGNEDLINTFRDKLLASYSNASVVYDEGIG